MLELEALRLLCEERGFRLVTEKCLSFGNGIILDKKMEIIVASEDVLLPDVTMASEYIRNLPCQTDYILTT